MFGFPCQDISNANPKGKGLKGERSSIFFECMRIVNILNPTWLLIENVPRLLSINEGRDFATVLQTISESGYGYSWRVLDSQYFGVAQRRKRVFIVGCFGRECPPEILFEQKSGCGNDKTLKKMGQRRLCLSTRGSERQDPTAETFIASTVGTDGGYEERKVDDRMRKHNIIAQPLRTDRKGGIKYGMEIIAISPTITTQDDHGTPLEKRKIIVAQTLGATPRGNVSFIWQDTHIAETHPRGKRNIARTAKGMDSRRGIVIGNAVTVNVAQWIGERINNYVYL
jgi:DNA (cytosine-5)-methyltransferase 1